MKLFTSKMLERLMGEQKKKSEGLLPEIIKRLIRSSCPDYSYIRAPEEDDIWAPGYDGIVDNGTKTPYVAQGTSVWEFGTNADSLEKINSDYGKRTTRPLGVKKSDTTFYLVVPKIWAYNISLTEWEAEHRDEWKAVYVYDASVLCDWLNSEPAVCAWLIQNYLENEAVEIDSVAHAWEQFVQRTNPPLNQAMFQIGREEQLEAFRKKVNEKICRVAAESRIEAYGFCLAALIQDSALAEQVTVICSETTYHQLDGLCENAYFLLKFPYNGQVSGRNRTILCEGKGTAKKDAIRLLPRWKTQYLQALQEMGIDSANTDELYSYTHGNLPALIRKIPGNEADLQPEWMSVADIDLLQPLVLLRHYNILDEKEKQLVARLAETPYPVVERKYEELLRIDDSPIKKAGEWYQIVNDEEAWLALNMDIESAVGQRMHQEIHAALSCTDAAQNHRRYGVLQRLLKNYICFAETGSDQNMIDAQVREILSFFHKDDCKECLIKELRILAEAAPEAVLEFLKKEQLGGQNEILWTLDTLIERENTCLSACQILYQLALQGGQNYKEVKQHLLDALCLWSSHTALTLEEKKVLTIQIIQQKPDFGVEFGIELLCKTSLIRGHRRGKKERPAQLIPEQELVEAYDEITRAVYRTALQKKWLGQIEKLIKEYRRLGQDVLLEMAEQFDATQFSSTALQPIQYWLKMELYNSKKYDWSGQIEVLEAWVRCTEPDDLVGKFGWMFSNWQQLPAEELLNDENEGWKKKAKDAEKLRETKFLELRAERGMVAVQQLLEIMEDQYPWGAFLARNTSNEDFTMLVKSIRSQSKVQVLAGFLDHGDFQKVIDIFEKLPETEQLAILSMLWREETKQLLITSKREQAYWKKRVMVTYSEQEYRELLQHHPGGLLTYLWDQSNQIEQLFGRFKEVLEAVAEKGLVPEEMGYLSEIINEVDEQFYSDEWAQCCLTLYKKKRLREFPRCLQRYLFYNPEEMTTLLNENDSFRIHAYYYYALPKEAFLDKETFNRWCECLEREHLDILGRILGRSGKGKDDIFPNEFVREFLEVQQNEALTSAVAYGKINSRSARIVQDGRDLYQQAKCYRVQARELELRFPQSAEILRQLAKWLESEAQHDQLEAEIVP